MVSQARRIYVQLMMQVVGRAMQAISEVDDEVRKETAVLPDGFLFEMTIMPDGPALVMGKMPGGRLRYMGEKGPAAPDLSIQFKHLTHAFLVLSFQEKTSQSFANDRMLVDGDLGYSLRMVRVLNRLESFILPKLIAERAVKEYPHDLHLPKKLIHGARIYFQVATNLIDTVRAS
ncbi:hypothetical protein QQM79_19015 [Marinobacteraceae bacterium S3BR75-40.1]